MKKFKIIKLFSIMLTLSLICTFSLTVHSQSVLPFDNSILISENAISTVTGDILPSNIKSFILESDIVVDDNSLIEVLPIYSNNIANRSLQSTSNDKVLCVTNITNNDISKSILLILDSNSSKNNGTNIISPPDDLLLPQNRASTTYSYPSESDSSNIVITATAHYNRYFPPQNIDLFSPYRCSFNYYKQSVIPTTTIGYINIVYSTIGIVYNLSDYSSLGYEDSHYINLYQTNPQPNTTYTETSYYDTGKALYPYGAGFTGGNYLDFSFVENGSFRTYSMPFN